MSADSGRAGERAYQDAMLDGAAFDGVDRLLTRKEVMAQCSIRSNTLYRLRKTGRFPQPVKISDRAIRWWQSDIDRYLQSLPRTK